MSAPGRPDVILHLGLHKTGTTAIQMRIRRNRTRISPFAETIVRQDRLTRAVGGACGQIQAGLAQGKPTGDAEAQLRRELAAVIDGIDTGGKPLLISDEMLSGRMVGLNDCWHLFPALPDLGRIFLDALAPLRTHLVVYHRDTAPWLVSAHNQTVKTDRVKLDFAEFSARIDPGETLSGTIDRLIAAVGAEHVTAVRMEEEARSAGGLGTALFRLIGMADADIEALGPPPRSNPSLGPGALDFMLAANRADLPKDVALEIRRLVVANPDCFRR